MVPAAIEVVGGIRIAEQASEPETQIPGSTGTTISPSS
jgi:hypothetical protein